MNQEMANESFSLINQEDFAAYRKRIQLVLETADQVKKDFGLFNVDVEVGGDPESAYGRLIEQISPVLAEFASEKPLLFRELMYRIDVDEAKLTKLIGSSQDSDDVALVYAEIIIEREFRKVLTRHLFREYRLKS